MLFFFVFLLNHWWNVSKGNWKRFAKKINISKTWCIELTDDSENHQVVKLRRLKNDSLLPAIQYNQIKNINDHSRKCISWDIKCLIFFSTFAGVNLNQFCLSKQKNKIIKPLKLKYIFQVISVLAYKLIEYLYYWNGFAPKLTNCWK
jgi:hypothetical protein